ncbi:MAG: ATP-binding protein [Lachnospiraceae bacterium]|nr:ATP-binding protein [Lachnospiraceae bacterium]
MKRNNPTWNLFLKKLFLQLMAVNIINSLVQPINNLIDSMFIGAGIGIGALEAYALFLPISAFVVAISMVFSIGTQINCSHMLGWGDTRRVKSLTQTAFFSAIIFSIVFSVVLMVFSTQIATLLGASSEINGQIQGTSSYIRGYVIGVPFIFLTGVMMSLLQIEGKKKLIILLSIVNLIINVLGDIISIYVIDAGLFGVAIATSVANIAVCIIAIVYFVHFSKMFKFSILGFRFNELSMIIRDGLPSFSYYGSLVLKVLIINYITINYLDPVILAVIVVVNSYTNITDAIMGGCGDVTLLFEGILYGEKDIKGMGYLLKLALISTVIILFVVTVLTIILSPQIAMMFSDNNDVVFLEEASRAITIVSFSFVINGITCVIKKHTQAVGRRQYASITNILGNIIYTGLFSFLLVRLFGTDGLFMSYTICYVLILITHLIYAKIISLKTHRRGFDIMLFLPDNDDIADKDIYSTSANTVEECVLASKEVERICGERGIDDKRKHYARLIIEEVSLNVIEHGFDEKKDNIIIVRVIFCDDTITISVKDNCSRFDPKAYYDIVSREGDKTNSMGLHIVMQLAKNVAYTNSFDMNNLIVEI